MQSNSNVILTSIYKYIGIQAQLVGQQGWYKPAYLNNEICLLLYICNESALKCCWHFVIDQSQQ